MTRLDVFVGNFPCRKELKESVPFDGLGIPSNSRMNDDSGVHTKITRYIPSIEVSKWDFCGIHHEVINIHIDKSAFNAVADQVLGTCTEVHNHIFIHYGEHIERIL